jgi:glycosyltransferase involved in cell wall biosynthesis
MSNQVSIAVITCTFNSSATIHRNIQSVNEQSYKNFRHIFIDGASSDDTLEIIREFAENPLIISEKDDGLYDAFNRGLNAVGEYDVFGFLHSDDHFADEFCLVRVAKAFNERPKIGYYCAKVIHFSSSDGETLDIVGRGKEPMTFWRYLRRSNEYGHPSYYCRTKLIPKVGYFDTKYKISADIDWIIRLENLCSDSLFDPKPLVKMMGGGNSTSNPTRAFYEEYSIFKKFGKRKFNLFFFLYYVVRSTLKNFLLKLGLGSLVGFAKNMLVKIFGD